MGTEAQTKSTASFNSRCNSAESSSFLVKNGVRQGAILSHSVFCVYNDTLLVRLLKSGVGGSLGWVLFWSLWLCRWCHPPCPTRQGLQIMLDICEDFSTSHSMLFSTDPVPAKLSVCSFQDKDLLSESWMWTEWRHSALGSHCETSWQPALLQGW